MTSSSAFARGDVVTVEFPFAEGAGTKDRPALILAGPNVHGDYSMVMMSSDRQDDGVPIGPGDFIAGGLARDSFARVRRLFTLDSALVVGKRGTLKPAAVTRVLAALCPTLGCKP